MPTRGNFAQICVCHWDSKMDIPASDSFVSPLRRGFLLKLTGKGWLYSGTWKRRFCVLDNSKLYFYEGERSLGSDKSSGVINLDYFDVCEEGRDKKNPHVFTVGTSVRGLFDNRHQFAAESSDELESWMRAIRAAITEASASRRKQGKKRHLDDKTSSNSSQDSDEPTPLVNATKDRARGPQGRRLPMRKSLLPPSRISGEQQLQERQRSISLSSPHWESDPPNSHGEPKWLSVSMEAMDREETELGEERRSSSVFDLPNSGDEQPLKKRSGNLLGNQQHAAVTRELEMRLKAGMAPGARRLHSESGDSVEADRSGDVASSKLDRLATRLGTTTDALAALELRVGDLSKRVDNHVANDQKHIGDVLLRLTMTLQEAERINAECKRSLDDANNAKAEYQLLAKQCQETLAKLTISDQEEV